MGLWMNLSKKNIVITGASGGIGEALSRSFIKRKANVFMTDIDEPRLSFVAESLNCPYHACDVVDESNILSLVNKANSELGHIDLFCSNAGILFKDEEAPLVLDERSWTESWRVNVMSHVFAARHVLPQMVQRQSGYFLQIISAAALLSQIGASAYSATKSAALSFAESLAISHGHNGIRVSAACPQYVATPMLGFDSAKSFKYSKTIISPDQAAERIVDGVLQEKFLIFTDSDLKKFYYRKCKDYDLWIAGMQRLRKNIVKETGAINLDQMHKFV